MMAMMYKSILPYTMDGRFCSCSRFSGGASFKRPSGDVARVNALGITTFLDACTKPKLFKYITVQQLKDKDEFIYADGT